MGSSYLLLMKINKVKLKKVLRILALGICYFFFVMLTGISVPCPLRRLSHGHIHCPGCGVSRMCMSIAGFDFEKAFYWNPVIFCLLPLWMIDICLWLFDRGERFIFVTEVISIVLLVVFFLVRNLPVWPLY